MASIDVGTFTSPWGEYDPTGQYGKVRYWKDSFGYVHTAGLIGATPYTNGSGTQGMFQLPLGYRPAGGVRLLFMCASYEPSLEQFARVDVDTNGNFIYMAGGRYWISLAGITYLAA